MHDNVEDYKLEYKDEDGYNNKYLYQYKFMSKYNSLYECGFLP